MCCQQSHGQRMKFLYFIWFFHRKRVCSYWKTWCIPVSSILQKVSIQFSLFNHFLWLGVSLLTFLDHPGFLYSHFTAWLEVSLQSTPALICIFLHLDLLNFHFFTPFSCSSDFGRCNMWSFVLICLPWSSLDGELQRWHVEWTCNLQGTGEWRASMTVPEA